MAATTELTKTNDMPLAVKTLRDDLGRMSDQFKFALPAHIPVERFVRVVMTAVQRNPKLLRCTRQSFFNACMSAANDGLLPDGREGAIVPYGDDEGGGSKSENAQWLPMIGGLRKKVRNSGVLTDWNVQVVQQGDDFDYALGDNPFIHHKPSPKGGRARPVLFAYSIATYPDGTKSREVMNIDQLMDIQKKSKARKGPWSDPVFFPEMCRKTVARLHSKQLPMSTDLDRLMQRDDALYDFAGARDVRKPIAPPQRPESVAAALDTFAGYLDPPDEATPATSPAATASPAAGTTTQQQPQEEGGAQSTGAAQDAVDLSRRASSTEAASGDSAATADPLALAYERGQTARADGHARKAMPGEYRDGARKAEATAWLAGFDGKSFDEELL
jgi:recombination protein RecT